LHPTASSFQHCGFWQQQQVGFFLGHTEKQYEVPMVMNLSIKGARADLDSLHVAVAYYLIGLDGYNVAMKT
jgi:hypothetical protein